MDAAGTRIRFDVKRATAHSGGTLLTPVGCDSENAALPDGMTALPLDNPCLRYEFELRHLGRLGQLALSWQGRDAQGSRLIHQRDCPFSASGPGLQ